MFEQNYLCTSCGANWTEGEYSVDCRECGGGAMERSCILCGGHCGSKFKRAVIDSMDAREAHWVGSCKLPLAEKQNCMKELLDKKD